MNGQDKAFLIIGALLLATAASLSAYGFHGLADSLTEADRLSWRWAVQMQVYHALGLILLTLLNAAIGPSRLLTISRALFVIGIFVFSGSIYAEKLGAAPAIGEIAPYGGSSFMLGWVLVAIAVGVSKRGGQG